MKKMYKSMRLIAALAALLSTVALPGCGGHSGDASLVYPDRQFGVSESELRDATKNPNGVVVGRGSGLVMMRLEPSPTPAPNSASACVLQDGDTACAGVDTLWFDVDYPGTVSVDLTGDAQSVVSQVEVLDEQGARWLSANAATPKASVALPAGRYLLRLTAATGSTEVMLAMVWFGGTSNAVNLADLQKLGSGNCPGCSLQRANLSGTSLHGSNLADADLSHALLLRGGLTLSGTDVMALIFGGSAVRGADLGGANLERARLDGAYMTGGRRSPANLHGANLASASVTDVFLAGADLGGANLHHADFSRSVLTGVDLQGASPSNAVFVKADLSGANLFGAQLAFTNFTGANLSGANLYGANLASANFTDANLSGADLRAANIPVHTNFTRANLSKAIWSNGHVCADPSVGACL